LTVSRPDDPMGVTIHRLDNGLTVFISTDREQRRVFTRIVVRAGSRHDPPSSTGLAHYLEHILFNGTAKLGTLDGEAERPALERIRKLYGELFHESEPSRRAQILAEIDRQTQATARWVIPNELDRLFSRLGMTEVNAFTDFDSTTFAATVPSPQLEQWACLQAESLAHPSFRHFLQELEVVYEEKSRTLDSPERRMSEALLRTLYPTHPDGTQSTIGESQHLRKPAYADMVQFFERWYVPENMAIVLAGDVDPEAALPILRAHFGRWPARSAPRATGGELTPLRGRSFRESWPRPRNRFTWPGGR
jgi:predicted Zn-dependent peptidase